MVKGPIFGGPQHAGHRLHPKTQKPEPQLFGKLSSQEKG